MHLHIVSHYTCMLNHSLSLVSLLCICLLLHRTKWVKSGGVLFKKGAGIVIGMVDDQPQVGQISTTYILNSNIVLFRAIPFSSSVMPHFRGYALHDCPCDCEQLLYMSKLLLLTPVCIRKPQALSDKKIIILPHHIHSDT